METLVSIQGDIVCNAPALRMDGTLAGGGDEPRRGTFNRLMMPRYSLTLFAERKLPFSL